MQRQGHAEWKGGLKEGQGNVSTESKALDNFPYSFHTRFEASGTNPEELIGAAHAGCFSMAFAAQLEKAGFIAENIKTVATVSLIKETDGFIIPTIHLNVIANVPNIKDEAFDQIAKTAKENCPVSKLMNAKITMTAKLS